MTDIDPRGKKLYATLKTDLQSLGVKIDDSFREFLSKKTTLCQIEGLDSYLNKLYKYILDVNKQGD